MRQTVPFPAFIDAHPPRQAGIERSFALFETEIVIPEYALSDAPVAFVHRRNGGGDSGAAVYRFVEGKLFRGSGLTPFAFFGRPATDFLSPTGDSVYRKIMREIVYDVTSRASHHDRRVHPSDLRGTLLVGFESHDHVKTLLSRSRQLVHRPAAEAAIAEYERRARQALDDHVVIGGEMWHRTSEPCYRAPLGAMYARVTTQTSDFYDRGSDPTHHHFGWLPFGHTDVIHFGADRLDEMREFLPHAVSIEAPVDVLAPEAMTLDFAAMEVDRYLRVLVESIAMRMAADAAMNDSLDQFPDPVLFEAWCDAVDFVRSYDPRDGVPEGVDLHIRSVVDNIGEFLVEDSMANEMTGEQSAVFLNRWASTRMALSSSRQTGYGA